MNTKVRIALAMLMSAATWLAHAADFPSGYSKCADQGGTCTIKNAPNTVAYGIKDKWVYKYVTSSTIACTTAAFGSDPYPNVSKKCSYNSTTQTGSATTSTPTPTKAATTTPTVTPTKAATSTPSPTKTATSTPTPTKTVTPTPTKVATATPTPTTVAASCSSTTFAGKSRILIGAQMEDTTATSAKFDVRYRYLAGGARPAGTCTSSCSSACGNWWGCWQDYSQTPGQYVLWHISTSQANSQIPMITYYEQLNTSGNVEGTTQVSKLNDSGVMTRYFDDWRYLLQTIGNNKVILHIEPDLWGFVRSVNSNPAAVPAAVTASNSTDCAAYENSATGVATCMIAMARKYAPNSIVGLHVSPWNYTSSTDAAAAGTFMKALGAANGDFIASDPADRDAGYYETVKGNAAAWWDDAKARQYLAWSKTVAETVGKPTVLWQVPLGNSSQNNTANHYKDNRVDWLFANTSSVAAAHIAGLFFGAGESTQTTPETDGGNLIAKTTSYMGAGGQALCQ